MDDQLVQRFNEGDPTATMAMRNQLRAMAARVLSSPQWELGAEARQNLEREAAGEAMEGGGKNAVAFTVAAMSSAAQRGLTWLRKRDGMRDGDHPARHMVVGVALQTASANHKLHVESHWKDCPACKHHFDVVDEALRGATKAQAAAQLVAPAPPPSAQPADDLASFARERARQQRKKPKAKKAAKKRRRRKKKGQKPPALWPILAVAGALAAGFWYTAQPSDEQRAWQAAAILPDELPPVGRAHTFDAQIQRAIESAADGDCRQAGNKLHAAAKTNPDDYWLAYYEGMAWVCERDGRRATAALERVDLMTTDVPWGYTWWLGQALLLDQRTDEGLAVLDSLGASSHPRADDARILAAKARNTL
jgi:hypothetical protein